MNVTNTRVFHIKSGIKDKIEEVNVWLEDLNVACTQIDLVITALEAYKGNIINKKFFDLYSVKSGERVDGTGWMTCPWNIGADGIWEDEFSFKYAYSRGSRYSFRVKTRSRVEILEAAKIEKTLRNNNRASILKDLDSMKNVNVEEVLKLMEQAFELCGGHNSLWRVFTEEAKHFSSLN